MKNVKEYISIRLNKGHG